MSIVREGSLAATLDALDEAALVGCVLTNQQRTDAAQWIAGRQGMRRSYRCMPAPTDADFACGVRVFTGEIVRSRAGISHILGEEACRALMLLGPLDPQSLAALTNAQEWLRAPQMASSGHYCCGRCSVAMWRHLATRPWPAAEAALEDGMRRLHAARGDAGWNPYPFWYTVLALTGVATPAAVDELRFAGPKLERVQRIQSRGDTYSVRRRMIAERALAMC